MEGLDLSVLEYIAAHNLHAMCKRVCNYGKEGGMEAVKQGIVLLNLVRKPSYWTVQEYVH
jgi:hypothetical protein